LRVTGVDPRESLLTFSLVGGPVHELGRRLGLVRGANTVRLGLALGAIVWTVIAVLALLGGVGDQLFTLTVLGAHARLLIVIPLLFMCESWVIPRMSGFVRSLADSGIVRPHDLPTLNAEVARMNRWKDAWWPEVLLLLATIALALSGARLQNYGGSGAYDPTRHAMAAIVYFRVGLILFQFLFFRGLYRLALWGFFLWRVSRLDLRLLPAHPDRAGGLGGLEWVHQRFLPWILAISVLECASVAEDISAGRAALGSVYVLLALVLTLDAALFVAPLLVFTPKLWASRAKGLVDYMGLAGQYATAFERKWIERRDGAGEPLLGTADIQSLADLGGSIEVVEGMRWLPIGPRVLTQMAIAATVPFLPLLLFKYPLAELAQKFFARLLGL